MSLEFVEQEDYGRALLSLRSRGSLPVEGHLPEASTGTVGYGFPPVDAAFAIEFKAKPKQAAESDFVFVTSPEPSGSGWQEPVFQSSEEPGEGGGAQDAVSGEHPWFQDKGAGARRAISQYEWNTRTARQHAQMSVDALASGARLHQTALAAVQQELTEQLAAVRSTVSPLDVKHLQTASAIKDLSVLFEEGQRSTRAQFIGIFRRASELLEPIKLLSESATRMAGELGVASQFRGALAEVAGRPSEIDRIVKQLKLALTTSACLTSPNATGVLPSSVAFTEAAERRISQLVGEGRVREARELLRDAMAVHRESAGLRGWQKVLARPTVRRVDGARARSRQLEYEWLKRHASEYEGQWVALSKDRLLASGPDFSEVLERIRATGEASGALVHFVSGRRTSSHV